MGADLLQAQEQENQGVENSRQQEAAMRCRDDDGGYEGQHIFERPILTVAWLDGECDPQCCEKHTQDDEVAPVGDYCRRGVDARMPMRSFR